MCVLEGLGRLYMCVSLVSKCIIRSCSVRKNLILLCVLECIMHGRIITLIIDRITMRSHIPFLAWCLEEFLLMFWSMLDLLVLCAHKPKLVGQPHWNNWLRKPKNERRRKLVLLFWNFSGLDVISNEFNTMAGWPHILQALTTIYTIIRQLYRY